MVIYVKIVKMPYKVLCVLYIKIRPVRFQNPK